MKHLKSIFLLSTALCLDLFAADPSQSLVKNGGFEEGNKNWGVTPGTVAEFGSGMGRNQTRGIRVLVTKTRRGVVNQNVQGIEKKQKYLVTAWIKADKYAYGVLTMDVYQKNGGYVRGAGFYNGQLVSGRDWSFFTQAYHHKGEEPEDHNYSLILLGDFLEPRNGGSLNPDQEYSVYFDDVMIVKDIPSWKLTQIYPTHNSISTNGGELILSNYFEQGFLPDGAVPQATAEMSCPGKKQTADLAVRYQAERIVVEIPTTEPGPLSLKITLTDSKTRKILGEKVLPVIVQQDLLPPANACILDKSGRAIVNGKPFMPLGVYCNLPNDGLSPSFLTILDKISSAKLFNCFVAYSLPYYIKTNNDLIRYFDEAQKRELKVLPCITESLEGGPLGGYRTWEQSEEAKDQRVRDIVNLIGRHPALLAYYIDDETSVVQIGKIIQRRKLINKYDPFHPAWGVCNQVEGFEFYLPAVDILAYDVYPIRENGTNFHTRWFSKRAQSLTNMIWAVPQCYQKDAEPTTVEKMMSPCAVEIIYGAKGFIFWSVGPTSFDKGDMNKRWPDLNETAGILKGLEPFILSDVPVRKLQVINHQEETEVALLTDGKGNYRIVAAGIIEQHQSDINIPENLKFVSSRFGHLKEIAPGVLRYEGGALSCDVVVLQSR